LVNFALYFDIAFALSFCSFFYPTNIFLICRDADASSVLFGRCSPFFTDIDVNRSPDGQILSSNSTFIISLKYLDISGNIVSESFLSLYGNTITIDRFEDNSYVIRYQKPLGFYIFLSPVLVPVFLIICNSILGEDDYHSFLFSSFSVFGLQSIMTGFLQSYFFSLVTSFIPIAAINIIEGNM
jgi:hypothetical protein